MPSVDNHLLEEDEPKKHKVYSALEELQDEEARYEKREVVLRRSNDQT